MCGSGSSGAPPPAGGGGSGCPPRQRQPGVTYTLAARWVTTQAYCGDYAGLEVTVTPLPPDGPVTVEVLHPSSGAVVDTLTGQMTNGRMNTNWTAKSQTANWRTDQISFRATASSVGASGTSSNQFSFTHRPTAARSTLDVVHVKTDAALGSVFEYHDATLEASRVLYSFKLRTQGSPFDATKQASAKSHIESVWNDGFSGKKFHRTRCRRGSTCDCAYDCCKADFHLEANFVASAEHVLIRVVATADGAPRQGSSTAAAGGRPITMTWGDPPRNEDSSYAHEIGHVLGQFDEYSPPVGGNDPTGVQPVTPPDGSENLLSTSGNTTLLNRHYRWALRYLNDNAAGDPYEIIPP